MQELFATVAPYAVQLLAAVLILLLASATRWARAKLKSEAQRAVLDNFHSVVADRVLAYEQTTVRKLKDATEGGKLTPEAATQAVKQVARGVKDDLGRVGIKDVERVIGGTVDEYLTVAIEAAVARVRRELAGSK